MKKIFNLKKLLVLPVVAALLLSAAACGAGTSTSADTGTTAAAGETTTAAGTEAAGASIVNIGVTNEVTTLNPLLVDGTETGKYATGLNFLPLVDLDKDNNFYPMLAESITTSDNLTFTVKLFKDAQWSDGTAITADDLIFTSLKITSDAIANPSMSTWAVIKGMDDSGVHPDAADRVEGIVKVDDQTVNFIAKSEMPLNTFQNTFARYLMTIPKHVLGDKTTEELKTSDWFSAPTVVSGPYQTTDFDGAHFVSYTANKNFFKGAPQIENLNFKVVQGSQLLIGLQTGEIDFVHQTMASFPQEDLAGLEALENVTVVYDKPLTNQLIFINTKSMPDVNMRKAVAQAIDRQGLVNNFLGGHGEVVEGFLTSYSPYFDDSIVPTAFDVDAAKASLANVTAEDLDKTYTFKVNSGDPTFVQAVNLVVQQLAEAGIKAKVQTEDINTLLTSASGHDFDMLAIQYTLAPVDPYPDVAWLMSGDNWVGYNNPQMDELIAQTQGAKTAEETKAIYSEINRLVQNDVPVINAYVISAPGAVSKRLVNAEPHIYGSFNEISLWTIK